MFYAFMQLIWIDIEHVLYISSHSPLRLAISFEWDTVVELENRLECRAAHCLFSLNEQ